MIKTSPLRPLLAASLLVLAGTSLANEAVIRKAIAERLPDLPKIDEVSKMPMAGLWEVRIGTDIFYTDESGSVLIEGQIVDTRTRSNLTQERIDKLTAIDVGKMPVKDAMVWKSGTGARKLYVFADPNCGYCKRFERDLNAVKDVTVYTFLYPILGGDSPEKSKNIWCSKDPTKTWRDWMLDGVTPPKTMGSCDLAALQRNAEFGRKHRVTGTPALVFEDGKRIPGAMSTAQIEQQLVASRAAATKSN